MKLRIKGNALRLRLTQTEVQTFGATGYVADAIQFGPGAEQQLQYILQRVEKAELTVSFTGTQIKLSVPAKIASTWTTTDQVGFEQKININGQDELLILVEKDFQCLQDRPHEDESDMFPNPSQGVIGC